MLVILFRSKLTDSAATDGYPEMAEEMETLARGMPGFVDVKAFKADDGERLTIVSLEGRRDAQRLARTGAPSDGAASWP